jgi:hypothetical protein
MHSTDDLNDGYVGSGTRLWRSIHKHGVDKHVCEILEHLPDRESLSRREEEILSKELRADPLCMNIRSGGTGNQPGAATSEETRQRLSVAGIRRWASTKGHHVEEFLASPFEMTREEILAELLTIDGQLDKNSTRNLKHRDPTGKLLREAQKARKWNFILATVQNTAFPDASPVELINAYVHNLNARPTCRRCGGKVTFFRFGQPYAAHCSARCAMQSNSNASTHK